MQTPLPEILELAREHQVEQEAFSGFVERLSALLARWEIPSGGRRAVLADYLDQRTAAGITAADEQPVVDALDPPDPRGSRLPRRRLHLQPGSHRRPRPPGFHGPGRRVPGAVARFLVEDKSTSVRDFERRQRKGAEEESPVEQLRRYVLAGAVHGRVGLLCNGWRLESLGIRRGRATRLVQIDLHELARAAPGRGRSCETKGGRSGRSGNGFRALRSPTPASSTDRSLTTPPLGVEGIERVQKALSRRGSTQDMEKELLAYYERVWREQAARRARQTPESLWRPSAT